MAKRIEKLCKNPKCKIIFFPRLADIKRGWGLYCSKSCKAQHQEQKTGQYKEFIFSKKYKKYQDEYGGVPEINEYGEYLGFTGCSLSIDDHDPNKDL